MLQGVQSVPLNPRRARLHLRRDVAVVMKNPAWFCTMRQHVSCAFGDASASWAAAPPSEILNSGADSAERVFEIQYQIRSDIQ